MSFDQSRRAQKSRRARNHGVHEVTESTKSRRARSHGEHEITESTKSRRARNHGEHEITESTKITKRIFIPRRSRRPWKSRSVVGQNKRYSTEVIKLRRYASEVFTGVFLSTKLYTHVEHIEIFTKDIITKQHFFSSRFSYFSAHSLKN